MDTSNEWIFRSMYMNEAKIEYTVDWDVFMIKKKQYMITEFNYHGA